MSDDVLQAHRIDPLVPDFVADPDLDALYKQLVAMAREHGWDCPTRQSFENQYKQEMAGKKQQ